MRTLRVTAFALAAALIAARSATGQATGQAAPPSPAPPPPAASSVGLVATRQGLSARAEQLELAAISNSQTTASRSDAAREAADIRRRLAEGDFRVGDRIVLAVEGEKALTDTFIVRPGIMLALPDVGDIPLGGVLRSELQDYLTQRLGQNLREPVVHATAYIRLSVVGGVAKPGYYDVPAQALLSDVMMVAGGPVATAKIQDMKIERGGHAILEKKALQHAIAAGMTVDDAGLIAGDQYNVPSASTKTTRDTIGFIALLLTIPLTVYSLTQIK